MADRAAYVADGAVHVADLDKAEGASVWIGNLSVNEGNPSVWQAKRSVAKTLTCGRE